MRGTLMTEPSEQLAAANLQPVDADACQEWDSAVTWRMSVFHEDRPTAVDRLLATHEGAAKWLRCQKWDAEQPKIVDGVRTGNWGNKAPATLRRIVRKP